ncbi:hypothetical protein AXK57_10105 [Tsukamurella pulmonis]|uniref:DUF3040 domain-containing protein n=1 Tax=Tsukamurella pulmonis TaxID=47312 RepID=A0A1H1FXK3_9ACTN|nr:DUF3040 domain-containing protein [Tsukamurella pulmonis]KXO87960.1 hypothetical protein AXK56_15125 [Tsukamurella pulmonis]KXP10725.1 hypothetical protein AXK57_10105 [Tsukamurella pulmonis]RDH12203.1 DUF3040 domain-containing protein [Tsukamurella pulmonis]SDR05714.1 Protein of unknown function [Tsukamurella pulmonis]SUP18242.1 Protein of uncharacterised function (DUF3040) [Tsukamurella pulmonis]
MPLSEHEQRMLDQIESALYAEDPKFASNVRGGRFAGASGKRRVIAAIGFAVGLMLLIAGMLLPRVEYTVIVGLIGFLLMFGSVVYALWSGPSAKGPRGTVEEDGSVRNRSGRGRSAGSARASGQSFVHRMEERFRRRFP